MTTMWPLLLAASDKSNVLILGNFEGKALSFLKDSFPHARRLSSMDNALLEDICGRKYDLILADLSSRDFSSDLYASIRILGEQLSDEGKLVLAISRRWSAQSLIQRVSKLLRWRRDTRVSVKYWKIRKALHSSRLEVEDFAAVPSWHSLEEFRSCPPFEGYLYARSPLRPIGHALRCWKRYVSIESDLLVVAKAVSGENLAAHIANIVQNQTGDNFRVERFFVRDRGTLVVIGELEQRGQRVVARVANTPEAIDSIKTNLDVTRRLAKLDLLEPKWQDIVATSYADFSVGDVYGAFEAELPGVLVWTKAKNRRIASRALSDSIDFLISLSKATRRSRHIREEHLRRLFGNDLQLIVTSSKDDVVSDDWCESVGDYLKEYFLDRTVTTVWSHGDFGFGNLLCNPKTGSLTGVIDWDSFSDRELPLVDLFNLLLQWRKLPSLEFQLVNIHSHMFDRDHGIGRCLAAFRTAHQFRRREVQLLLGLSCIRLLGRDLRFRPELLNSDKIRALVYCEKLICGARELSRDPRFDKNISGM